MIGSLCTMSLVSIRTSQMNSSLALGIARPACRVRRIKAKNREDQALLGESDPNSDDKLGRRIWWSLVIMDRWHASSTASPVLIPEASVVVSHEDKDLLGDPSYQLEPVSSPSILICNSKLTI